MPVYYCFSKFKIQLPIDTQEYGWVKTAAQDFAALRMIEPSTELGFLRYAFFAPTRQFYIRLKVDCIEIY